MLHQRIKELRQSCGWSQVDLGKKLNVTKQTVSNWENDNIQPSVEMLVRLSKIFNVSTDYLLGLDDRTLLDVTGLSQETIGHISLLVSDLQVHRTEP